MQNVLESKSILAKLMATENIHIEQRNVRTAAFNVKDRILVVPILDKNISAVQYDLFMGHEVGHALYTPIEGCVKEHQLKLNSGICNVIEDVRIERKIKYKYPGLRNSFVKAYRELYEKDFFSTQGADLQQMNFIDRINLHSKVGTNLGIKFNPIERELLREIENTETYDDVLDVAAKVQAYMQQQIEEQQKQMNSEPDEESEETDDDFDFDMELESDESNSDDYEEYEHEDLNSPLSSEKNYGVNIDKEMGSRTDESFKKNQEQLFESDGSSTIYVNVPKIDLNDFVVDYKEFMNRYKVYDNSGIDTKGFLKIRQETNKAVQYLAKEFELRKNAEQMKRASVAKTGELNMSKVFSYKFNDDIFKKMTIVPDGKSHGLVLLLDWSGSMSNHIGNTIKQLLALVMFCKKVNIPYEVYTFVEGNKDGITNMKLFGKHKQDDLICSGMTLFNVLSSRMSALEFTYCASALTLFGRNPRFAPRWMWMSGTPLNEAIIAMNEVIPKFQKDNRLQIVNLAILSDGDGHTIREKMDWDPEQNREFVSHIRNNSSKVRVYITDPVTKHQLTNNPNSSISQSDGRAQTSTLVKLLKARTGCNVIGFYILKGREFARECCKFFPTSSNFELMKMEFRKNKYCIATNAGFDEYYLLRSEAMNTEEDTEFEVKENATTRGLVSAFKKYAGARVSNRVVLNRFIGLIA
jgi:hypothetical protein